MIPTYEEVMLPFLKLLSDNENHSFSDTVAKLSDYFKLSNEERRRLLPSGQQEIFRNRVGWARTYMKKAGLIATPKRAHFKITDRGLELLKENPEKITADFLLRYPEFVEFKTPKIKEELTNTTIDIETDKTPEESLEFAFQKLKSELAKEVLEIIMNSTPVFFEKLVVDLL
jgi:restriction system protein